MKAKILILILLSSLILGCRTKTKASFYEKEGRTEVERVKLDSVKETTKKQEVKKTSEQETKKHQEEFTGDIVIRGKSDSLNPLVYHNIIGRDTLQSIVIRGNADFSINNHYKKSEENNKDLKKEESTNIIQDIAKTAVSKETIKDVASTITQKTREIKSTGFQAGAWIIWAILGILIIIATGIYFYFKKK